jgi:hypothetical protein
MMHNSQNNLSTPPHKFKKPDPNFSDGEAGLLLPLVLAWSADTDNWQQVGTVARRVAERALARSREGER